MTVFQNIQQMKKMLSQLNHLLDKASQHATEKKMDPENFLSCRIIADMFPLRKQIQIVTDTAKGMAFRLSGKDVPVFEDNPNATMEDLKGRVQKTLSLLNEVSEGDFEGFEDRKIPISFMKGKYLTGFEYYMQMAVPNFYFHMTTAYNILRGNGVALGKADFLGNLDFKDL